MDDTILHLSSFISAFANIMLELKELEDSYIEHLERLIGTFFIIFPQLHLAQREKYFAAVARLLVSLYSKGSTLHNLLSRIGMVCVCNLSLHHLSFTGTYFNLFQIYCTCDRTYVTSAHNCLFTALQQLSHPPIRPSLRSTQSFGLI